MQQGRTMRLRILATSSVTLAHWELKRTCAVPAPALSPYIARERLGWTRIISSRARAALAPALPPLPLCSWQPMTCRTCRITAIIVGPLCFLLAYAILYRASFRHALQIIVCSGTRSGSAKRE